MMVSSLLHKDVRTRELNGFSLGNWHADMPIQAPTTLEQLEENFEGRRKELFIDFMMSMLQWVPEHRKTAKELLDDPWLNNRME